MIDQEQLLKLRVLVGRFGEMDKARWWNTRGQLGRLGGVALRRGFPRTHHFAQARSVFAAASHRCAEVFDPPRSVTLWRLTPEIEAEFESAWEGWLDAAPTWDEFFHRSQDLPGTDLAEVLRSFGVVSTQDLEKHTRTRRSAEGRSVQLSGAFRGTNEDIAALALGFARGEPGAPAVPYLVEESV